MPFCDMKLTLFCVSTNSGLLHDVFQDVSVHPVPIEICYGLLSDVKDTNTFSLCVCVHMKPAGPTSSTFGSNSVAIV